jgi:glutaconate CoA-transferase, subunit A
MADAHGYYDRDNKSYLDWDKIAAERDSFQAWMQDNVLNAGPQDLAGRVEHLRSAK